MTKFAYHQIMPLIIKVKNVLNMIVIGDWNTLIMFILSYYVKCFKCQCQDFSK